MGEIDPANVRDELDAQLEALVGVGYTGDVRTAMLAKAWTAVGNLFDLVVDGGTGAGGTPITWSGLSLLSHVLTTKGDLAVYSSGPTRLPVGLNGYVLTANSTQPEGVAWATVASVLPWTPTASAVAGWDSGGNPTTYLVSSWQPSSTELAALAAISSTGLLERTGAGAYTLHAESGYFLVSGSRPMGGDLNLGGHALTGTNLTNTRHIRVGASGLLADSKVVEDASGNVLPATGASGPGTGQNFGSAGTRWGIGYFDQGLNGLYQFSTAGHLYPAVTNVGDLGLFAYRWRTVAALNVKLYNGGVAGSAYLEMFADSIATPGAGYLRVYCKTSGAPRLYVITPTADNLIPWSTEVIPPGDVLRAIKSATTARTNTTSLAADPHLSLPVVSGVLYQLEAWLVANSAGATPSVKVGWSTPGGSSMQVMITGATALEPAASAPFVLTGSGVDTLCHVVGYFKAGANGTFALSWAQNVLDAVNPANLKIGSWLRLTKAG